jgi:hypothetical protein
MKKSALERVQELAQKLSPEDRLALWHFLAELPDSGVQSGNLAAPETNLDGTPVQDVDPNVPVIVSTDTSASIFLKSREIFQVTFRPDNFQKSKTEVQSWRDAPPSERVKEQFREIFRLHGKPEPDEARMIEAAKEASTQIYDLHMARTAREFAARLKHMVWLLYDGGMAVAEFGWQNEFARQTGQRTKTLKDAIKMLEPHWYQIKRHLNVKPGGRRNVKHQWSVRDHTCLAVHYDRLKPIWRGAKKAAKQALEAKELSRRKTWKEQVAAAYKDEQLPEDLIEQLAPNINSAPADLALIHAARLCLPVQYSTKVLKQKLGKFNPVPKPSPKA